jgi:hypothetical protein
MIRFATIVIALFAIASPALASLPQHPGQHQRHVEVLRAEVGSTPVTLTTKRTIPASARLVCYVRFNGHLAQAIWQDSPNQLEYAWRGVIAIVTSHKKAGPGIVRVASARPELVRVKITYAWR